MSRQSTTDLALRDGPNLTRRDVLENPFHSRLDYSLRRHYVDEFFTQKAVTVPAGSAVLDLGGTKEMKRGLFDIADYNFRVVYLNLTASKKPDVQAAAEHTPFKNSSFDVVICSELFEHVPDPMLVINEAHRVLRDGGLLLACAPFLVRVHNDPSDYGRYTHQYFEEALGRAGFEALTIELQGLYWSVLVEMLRSWIYHLHCEKRLRFPGIALRLLKTFRDLALRADAKPENRANRFYSSFTTGYGIAALKRSR